MKIATAAALGLLAGLAGCAAGIADKPGLAAARGEPVIGRCYMGGCGWFRVVGQRVLREAGGERLVRANIAEGGSDLGRNQDHPRSHRDADIGWQPPTDDYYFLCSPARPMAIVRKEQGAGYDGFQLDFANGSFGASEAVSNQYLAVCHRGEDTSKEGFAARSGYREMEVSDQPGVDLATPEAVFDLRP
jgi:hypothetical protein